MTPGLLLLVAVAGGVGSALRYLVDTAIQARIDGPGSYPVGTTVINLTGSLLLGLLTGYAAAHAPGAPWLTVAGTGLLGGYTTFSTASVESVRLLLRRRYGAALVNGLGLLAGCLAAAGAGLIIGRIL